MEFDNYFDLIAGDISELKIIENAFDCILKNNDGITFKGFILSKSSLGNAYTLCDISFHKSNDGKYKPRLIFRRTDKELQDKKVGKGSIYQRISFEKSEDGYNEFWKMVYFLSSFKNLIDVGNFENEYKVISTNDFILSFKLKNDSDKIIDINNIIDGANLSKEDIETLSKNIVYKEREKSLDIFKLMLDNNIDNDGKSYIAKYKEIYLLKHEGEETAWHHFLKNNSWIIGLNLDLKFIEDFESEGNVGIQNTSGKGSPNVDLLGFSDYTVLVELKTANKFIFTDKKKVTSRTNTWSFSEDFIDGISQALGQKSEWDKLHRNKPLIKENEKGEQETINQDLVRTVDTDCIFIIGNKEKEFSSNSINLDIQTKRDTFKRYRENSKNIKIITFDELYERAKNILKLDTN